MEKAVMIISRNLKVMYIKANEMQYLRIIAGMTKRD